MTNLLDDTEAARRRRKVIAYALIALALVLLIVTFAWWRSLPNEDEPLPTQEDTVAPVVLSSADIFAAFESDPTLAEFEEGPFLVSGTLATTPDTGTVILLETPDPLLGISAELRPSDATELASAQPGAEVTLMCESITPGLRAPALESCTLATAP